MTVRAAKVSDVLLAKGSGTETIKPSETVGRLSAELKRLKIGAMVVSEDGKAVSGIISERDIAYSLAEYQDGLHTVPVSKLMTRKVVTCHPDDTVGEVMRKMTEMRIRHLPVSDGDRLMGIISMRDIMAHRLGQIQRSTKMVGGLVVANH
jgi:CBS domain-containing protein